jgi:hypothetical protein
LSSSIRVGLSDAGVVQVGGDTHGLIWLSFIMFVSTLSGVVVCLATEEEFNFAFFRSLLLLITSAAVMDLTFAIEFMFSLSALIFSGFL